MVQWGPYAFILNGDVAPADAACGQQTADLDWQKVADHNTCTVAELVAGMTAALVAGAEQSWPVGVVLVGTNGIAVCWWQTLGVNSCTAMAVSPVLCVGCLRLCVGR